MQSVLEEISRFTALLNGSGINIKRNIREYIDNKTTITRLIISILCTIDVIGEHPGQHETNRRRRKILPPT
jgi:hypothetical protein